ncbi:MAG: hypothetical protein WBI09_00840 [Methanothrix sp.]|jgi:hypothetical protein|uniref:hypothetical protein n=2 Tax=Methanothrix sp. TaxID=90426 RepID=UPI0032AF4DF8|nr:hypothetical protein [Euryarchaeota archaeon]
MLKYLAAFMLLLTIGVVGADELKVCTDCYANVITQKDTQTVENVRVGISTNGEQKVGIGNEGLSAAIIVTPKAQDAADGSVFRIAPFARIDQEMNQKISGLGSVFFEDGEGAKGLTWNKAIQGAWIANQGLKELEEKDGSMIWLKEGSYISQLTNQNILDIYDYNCHDEAKVLNVDNKLAMIVDNLNAVIELTASANTKTIDNQTSIGAVKNDVNITVAAKDP